MSEIKMYYSEMDGVRNFKDGNAFIFRGKESNGHHDLSKRRLTIYQSTLRNTPEDLNM
jgi:hypothetical protein